MDRMKCKICEEKLRKIFSLPRTKVHHARWFYSCGDHLYYKFFGSAVPNDRIGELHFLDIKGVPITQMKDKYLYH